jgi:hypothetical protein
MAGRSSSSVAFGGLAALALVGGGVAGGIAYANHESTHKTFSGGGVIAVRVATDVIPFNTSVGTAWANLPGSALRYTIPAGKHRLIRASFTAESFVLGEGVPTCGVRVTANKVGSATLVEFHPRAGGEFAFDSKEDGLGWEANAIERAQVLGAGTWTFRFQATTPLGGTCYLDDWYFDIEVHPVS